MLRLALIGVAIAAIGGVARLIWPDDWVYSNVSDERGVRSIKRRRGAPEAPQPQVQQPVPTAAAVPVGYPGYPQPYPAPYPQQWQGYPGYGPPPGYPVPYPTGPFAQPAPQPQQYTSPGRPTVPVTPVQIGAGEDLVAPPAPALDGTPRDLPEDAARVVPKVVARAETTLEESTAAAKASAPTSTKKSSSAPSRDAAAKGSDQGGADDDDAVEVPRVAEAPVVAAPIVPVVIPAADDPAGEKAEGKAETGSDDDTDDNDDADTFAAAVGSDGAPLKADLIEAADDEWAAEQDW